MTQGRREPLPDEALLTDDEVARVLRFSTRQLRRLILADRIPVGLTYVCVGSRRRWRRSDVETWITQQAHKEDNT